MKKLAWLTDIHLNFVSLEDVSRFATSVRNSKIDAVVITGDIAEAPTVVAYLQELEAILQCPIYFVLGNHDFYFGSFEEVHTAISAYCRSSPYLRWMNEIGVVEITSSTCLIGHDSWGDGRYGNYYLSSVALNDHQLIHDFLSLDKVACLQKLHTLGDEAAACLEKTLQLALPKYRRVILLTHVPPFREACLYKDQSSADEWSPYFACKAVGDMLIRVMDKSTKERVTVLCGHTHHAADFKVLPNLRVLVGQAQYTKPRLQKIFEIE